MTIHDFNWAEIAPAIGAASLASTVEFVEVTVVFAVRAARGSRHSFSGALSGVAALAIRELLFGNLLFLILLDALSDDSHDNLRR
jgi:uncharacterized membrane protein